MNSSQLVVRIPRWVVEILLRDLLPRSLLPHPLLPQPLLPRSRLLLPPPDPQFVNSRSMDHVLLPLRPNQTHRQRMSHMMIVLPTASARGLHHSTETNLGDRILDAVAMVPYTRAAAAAAATTYAVVSTRVHPSEHPAIHDEEKLVGVAAWPHFAVAKLDTPSHQYGSSHEGPQQLFLGSAVTEGRCHVQRSNAISPEGPQPR